MDLVNKLSYDGESEALVVSLNDQYNFITTLPFQPNIADTIVFKRVPSDFECRDLKGFYEMIRFELGYPNSIIFLTAAPVDDYIYVVNGEETIAIIATVGLEPPVCPGYSNLYEPLTGTINVAVVVDQALRYSALIDLLRVVVEAKSIAVSELLLRCNTRSPGTATDAVAVGGRLVEEGGIVNAGMSTTIGGWVSEVLYRQLIEVGLKKLGVKGLFYNTIGVSFNELVDLIVGVYSEAPIPGVTVDNVRVEVEEFLEELLEDPSVWSFLIAAREIDLHVASGSIPGLRIEGQVISDKVAVASEILAQALSSYIARSRGIATIYNIEIFREKGRTSSKLLPFEEHIISALVNSILAILYERLRGGTGWS